MITNNHVRKLCEAWFDNEVSFQEVLKIAADNITEFQTWHEEKSFGEIYIDPKWIDGTSTPHPITQCKIVEEIMELV